MKEHHAFSPARVAGIALSENTVVRPLPAHGGRRDCVHKMTLEKVLQNVFGQNLPLLLSEWIGQTCTPYRIWYDFERK